jgi:hypothetical protein
MKVGSSLGSVGSTPPPGGLLPWRLSRSDKARACAWDCADWDSVIVSRSGYRYSGDPVLGRLSSGAASGHSTSDVAAHSTSSVAARSMRLCWLGRLAKVPFMVLQSGEESKPKSTKPRSDLPLRGTAGLPTPRERLPSVTGWLSATSGTPDGNATSSLPRPSWALAVVHVHAFPRDRPLLCPSSYACHLKTAKLAPAAVKAATSEKVAAAVSSLCSSFSGPFAALLYHDISTRSQSSRI